MKTTISIKSSMILTILALALAACGQMSSTAIRVPSLTVSATATTGATFLPTVMVNTPTPTTGVTTEGFSGERAYQDVQQQMALGPRTPGSAAHDRLVEWLKTELQNAGWEVEVQETTYQGKAVRNVIAKRGVDKTTQPWIILGAHYDSRLQANQDPDPAKRTEPVPGANDGASGVAVLTELARTLPKDLDKQVWLVFIDSEDQGDIDGWDWILGSRAFAESLTAKPDAVVIVDMIGDADLNIYLERNSTPEVANAIWQQAAELGYQNAFIPEYKYNMVDDHTPFLEKGIRAVDIIDFDYPYWHTTQDTADKVSAESLHIVGDTLLHWLEQK